ncbi:MAG: threonine-phosphate decarboxylase [Halobacteriales archaeon]|jgi:threonine-phosphate decarboxylase
MDPEDVAQAQRVPHGGATDSDVLDFSANLNPRTPEGVRGVYRDAFDSARRYPDDTYPEFRAAAGEYVGCDPEDVIPTPGGLAAIRLAIEVTVEAGDSVLVPAPSFGEFAREVRLQGAEPTFVPHDRLLESDPGDHALAIACTPNNPTGDAYDPDALRAFAARCRDAGTPLLVDEAFLGFTDLPGLAGEPGVIVARSLTKLFGLPGLRMGFAVATGDLGDRLATVRRTWNLSAPATAVGTHCMRDEAFVAETRQRVREERGRLREGLADRFGVHDSDAPFLLLDVTDGSGVIDADSETAADVDAILDAARDRGIALRDARTFRGLDSHVRVAVLDRDANDRLLEVLTHV